MQYNKKLNKIKSILLKKSNLSHKMSPAVWAAKSEDDRNQHFKDFSKPNNRYVVSTDGTRTVPTLNGGKKPH